MQSIEQTLEERGSRYGSFTGHAKITQDIKRAMQQGNWPNLADDQKECLEMIAHKVGRILNGDPDYHDSWHDIVGYTKLVADRLAPKLVPETEETTGTVATAPTQKRWLPGMLCDETTPEGTRVKFFDDPEGAFHENGRTTHSYMLCGMDKGGFKQSPTSITPWRYAVVVDENGNFDEELLKAEIARVKQGEAK